MIRAGDRFQKTGQHARLVTALYIITIRCEYACCPAEWRVHDTMGSRTMLAVIVCIAPGALLFVPTVEKSASPKPIELRITRQHSGKDCSSGQMSLEGEIVAYTLERPWEGNIPLISSIPTGRYHGNVQLHVGNFLADGVGCILLGSNLKSDLCTLSDSKAAFDKFKIAFNEAAGKHGQTDDNTPIELTIEDLMP